ncbi:MAG: hypothetical protein KGO81_11420 [Bacteroidota bacterium]|nr:hypothetical protein [Bacteroidota bacterium]
MRMKKVVAIFLFSLYFFGSTEAYQLLKLPLLVKHYIKHKEEDPSINITAFLKLHYNKKMVVDDDFQQDMQLPFKTNNADACLVASVSMPASPVIFEYVPLPEVKNEFIMKNDLQPIHPLRSAIFQPPKNIC